MKIARFIKYSLTALTLSASINAFALPSFVDNTKLMYFPPLVDQKGGSCAQASGIGYMLLQAQPISLPIFSLGISLMTAETTAVSWTKD